MRKPNVVVVMTDQQKANSLALYGNPIVQTPALERLAEAGAVLDGFHAASPLCVPARTAFWTGRWPHTTGSRWNSVYLNPLENHLPKLLKEQGYRLGLFGKNHCFTEGPQGGRHRPDQPSDDVRLFDEVFNAGHFGVENEHDELASFLGQRKFKTAYYTESNPLPASESVNVRVTERAIRFIERYRDEPFLLWLSYPDPHHPFQAPEPYASMYPPAEVPLPPPDDLTSKPLQQQIAHRMFGMHEASEEGIRAVTSMYYGMVRFVDDCLGQFLAHLANLGLDEDTIVVFTTDHGEYLGEHGLMHKTVGFYDCIVRLPFVISWPGVIGQARHGDLLSQVDVLPTLLDLLELPSPAGVQGRSFSPLLLGTQYVRAEAVFAEAGVEGQPLGWDDLTVTPATPTDTKLFPWDSYVDAFRGRAKMVRTERWKYCYYSNGDQELYDMRDDPAELVNLAGDARYTDVIATLKEYLLRWLIQSEDTLPPLGDIPIPGLERRIYPPPDEA